MNTDIYFWGWLILALVFLAGEIVTAGFFLAAFGVGAALAAVAAAWDVEDSRKPRHSSSFSEYRA